MYSRAPPARLTAGWAMPPMSRNPLIATFCCWPAIGEGSKCSEPSARYRMVQSGPYINWVITADIDAGVQSSALRLLPLRRLHDVHVVREHNLVLVVDHQTSILIRELVPSAESLNDRHHFFLFSLSDRLRFPDCCLSYHSFVRSRPDKIMLFLGEDDRGFDRQSPHAVPFSGIPKLRVFPAKPIR